MKLGLVAAAATIAALRACIGEAAVISYSASVPLTTTDFATSIDVQKFDPALGALIGITIQLDAVVFGTIGIENLSAGPASISYSLEAFIRVEKPDHGVLAEFLANTPISDDFEAFDGSVDFAGTSGATHVGLTGMRSESISPSLPSVQSIFTGSGLVSLPVMAMNDVPSTRGFQAFGTSSAGLDLTVTYSYEPARQAVPEPPTLVILVLSAIMTAMASRAGAGDTGQRRCIPARRHRLDRGARSCPVIDVLVHVVRQHRAGQ